MRLPQVHDTVRQCLITYAVAVAREKGVSAYVGEGRNRWAAAHISDVARLYRLALEKNEAGAKYHAVAEEGVPMRGIAEAIGRGLKAPVKSISVGRGIDPLRFSGYVRQPRPSGLQRKDPEEVWVSILLGPGLIADLERLDVSDS